MQHNMFQGHINGPVMAEEGAVYTGKGKYRLQFLGSSNPKELTRRAIIIAAVLVLAVLLAATLLAGRDPSEIPYVIQLNNAMGQPLDNALVNAGLKTAGLTEIQPGVYAVDVDVKVDGIQFDLQLYVDEGVLCGFAYTAEYEADARKAAKDIYNFSSSAGIDAYAPVDGAEPVEISKKMLLEYLNQGKDILIEPDPVNITPSALSGALRQYLEELESAEDWEGNVHGYLVRPAQIYMDRKITYTQDTSTVKILISYSIAAEQKNN